MLPHLRPLVAFASEEAHYHKAYVDLIIIIILMKNINKTFIISIKFYDSKNKLKFRTLIKIKSIIVISKLHFICFCI
jgi:hypothetical protein